MSLFSRLTRHAVVFFGCIAALYLGLWVCLIGGILNIVQAFKPFAAGLFVIGMIKVLASDIIAMIVFNSGFALANWIDKEEHYGQKIS